MLLGEKQEIGQKNQMLLKLDGVLHIAAISGTHLSFLGWGLYRLLRKLRLSVAWAGGISVFLMIQYGIFTGGSASAMRAVIMFSLAVGAIAVGRTYDLLSALSLSAVLLLLESPGYLYDSGFLLSCIRDYGGTVISRSLGGIWKHNGFSVCFDFHFRRRSYENKFYIRYRSFFRKLAAVRRK